MGFQQLSKQLDDVIRSTATHFTTKHEPPAYSQLAEETESDHESGTTNEKFRSVDIELSRVAVSSRSTRSRIIILVVIAICSATFAGLGYWAGVAHSSKSRECPRCYVDDEQCTVHLSTASPAIDANVVEYFTELWPAPPHAEHTFSGPPTYDRELAWRSQEYGGTINVPQHKLSALGKSDDVARLRSSADAGGGYAATLMVHHQLQCLGALRRWTYKDEYLATMVEIPDLFRAPKDEVHRRLDYCIDLLRRSLMCTSDVTPILLPLNTSAPNGLSMDLWTTHKKCRNFNKIMEWEAENRASDIDVVFSDAFPLPDAA